MTLAIVNTTFNWATNTLNDTLSSFDSADSPSWRVSNLNAGTLVNLGTGINTSDVGYNEFTKRFCFIRNNAGTITEFSESDIVNSVASPTIIRVLTITGLFGSDTEGLTDVYRNLSEGGYEFWVSAEDGGRNLTYNVPITESEMLGTSDISVAQRQELTMAAPGGTNNGQEGVGFDLAAQEILGVQEGAIAPRIVYVADRPVNRDTDYDYLADAELTVTEPFDAEAIIPGTNDLSSCCYHTPTGHLLLLSENGNTVYQYQRDGTLVDSLTGLGTAMFQPEGICMHGDNMVIMGEVDECVYYTYTAP